MVELLPIQEQIWNEKYRFRPAARVGGLIADASIEDTWRRVASALAAPEGADHKMWTKRFYGALEDFAFIPAGRVLSGAGTGRNVTLFNCFVQGTIADSMDGIFSRLREGALTMQQGGGIGMDFSTLRPKGDVVKGVGADASGPLSFMDCWNVMCGTVMSAGARRGAMMGTMRCDHPDIEAFIEAKRDPLRLRNFNISVLATDEFMGAIETGEPFSLRFGGKHYRYIDPRELWKKITRNAYDFAEPGVIFIDRINAYNNLRYCETICSTNPCAEQPLPPNGACLLGSINLTAFVRNPFDHNVYWDAGRAMEVTKLAVRMLDNVIDVSNYPIPEQKAEALAKRRIGLGITGLADTLIMCGLHYGEDIARNTAAGWMDCITQTAYRTSIELAEEKGAFPLFDQRHGYHEVDRDVSRQTIFDRNSKPIRNSHLISIAPTGTISLLAGNVSSGIEPVFEWKYERKILRPDGSKRVEVVEDYAVQLWNKLHGAEKLPPAFHARHHELTPQDHLGMQAACQPHVDTSISKTVNCPEDMPFEDFQNLYTSAFKMNLKCCAAFRPNNVTGSILSAVQPVSALKPGDTVTFGPNGASIDRDGTPVRRAWDKDGKRLEPFEVKDDASLVLTEEGKKQLLRVVHEASGVEVEKAEDMIAGDAYIAIRPNGTNHPDVNPPAPRDHALNGTTYKLRWPPSPHAIYVTLNDCDDAPFEIFINSKNLEHYAWTVGLTRMISAIFRRGGDVGFVVEELKAVFDPKGGAWIDGGYVPSLLAAIGGVIEKHIKAKAWREPSNLSNVSTEAKSLNPKALDKLIESLSAKAKGMPTIASIHAEHARFDTIREGLPPPEHTCPRCASSNVTFPKPHCLQCLDCNHSTCG